MKLKLVPSTIPSHSFPLHDSSFHRHKLNFIVAAKSKKKHHNNDAQGSDSQPSPPRITSNVKQSLRILKAFKDYEKRKSTGPKPPTRYRKKKAEKKTQKTVTPDDDDSKELVIINNDVPPVYLVDGYNLCGYWLKLKEHFMNGRLDLARQLLILELKHFSMIREVKVVVVFDAMMSGFRNHKERSAGIDIVFPCDTSADMWIEREVLALKKDGCPEVWVVTSDRAVRQSVIEPGVFVWSCETFVSEIEASQKEADEMVQVQSSNFSLLKRSLDPKVVDALRNLRQQLSEKESEALKNPRQKPSEKESDALKNPRQKLFEKDWDALKNLRQKLAEKESDALKNPRQKLSEKESDALKNPRLTLSLKDSDALKNLRQKLSEKESEALKLRQKLSEKTTK